MISDKSDGIFLYDMSNAPDQHVRVYYPTQHTILTIASSDFPKEGFEQENPVYVRINQDGKYEVARDLDKETFLMRVIERTVLSGVEAYTFIISKTKSEPIINKSIEDQYIQSHLRKDFLTEISQ